MFRAFSMAGFQMTLYGRIWVTPEGKNDCPELSRTGCVEEVPAIFRGPSLLGESQIRPAASSRYP